MKDQYIKGKCPNRLHDYTRDEKIPLCRHGSCTHILLRNETVCPCHEQPKNWRDKVNEVCIDADCSDMETRRLNNEFIKLFESELQAIVEEIKNNLTPDSVSDHSYDDGYKNGFNHGLTKAAQEVVRKLIK